MKRAVEDGVSLLAGAGIGMAIMYLLDPESGARRRERLGRSTGEMLHTGGEYLGAAAAEIGSTASRIGSKASDFRERLSSRLTDAAESAGDTLSDSARSARRMISRTPEHWWERAGESARRMLHRGSDRAQDLYESGSDWMSGLGSSISGFGRSKASRASSRAGKMIRRAGSYVPHEPEHHYIGQTACALGSLALGAGILYFFDPQQGRGRRARLRDKAVHYTNETGDFFRKAGRRLSDELQGTYYEAKNKISSPPVDDRTLAERVRSKLGRITQRAGNLQVSCSQGRVMICGETEPDEIDRIVNGILGVRGVRTIDNQLRGQAASK